MTAKPLTHLKADEIAIFESWDAWCRESSRTLLAERLIEAREHADKLLARLHTFDWERQTLARDLDEARAQLAAFDRVREQYRHLDALLCDRSLLPEELVGQILYDCWQAIKQDAACPEVDCGQSGGAG